MNTLPSLSVLVPRPVVGLLAGLACLALQLPSVAPAQVLVSDFNLDRIVRFAADGSSPSVLVAAGAGGLDLPHRSRVGPDGLLYVASAGTDQILRFNATSGTFVDVFAGSGGVLDYPVDLVFQPDGYLYASSQLTNSILRYDAATGVRDTGWSAQHASLAGPSGIVFDSAGNLFVAGRFSNNVVRFDAATGAHELTFGTVSSAFGLTFHPDGRLLAASGGSGSVVAFSAPASATPASATFATGLNVPVGLELDSLTDTLLTANYGSGSISRAALADGSALTAFASGGGLLSGPNFLTVSTPAPIPEPSAFAVLVSLGALASAFARRRR
jgi:DNA-binding beta-propeller fold protein YncE